MRIEVGRGLEGALTNAQSGRIIRDVIAPQFRQDNYYQDIYNGTESIIAAIHSETDLHAGSKAKPNISSLPFEFILFALFFIPAWLGAILARSKKLVGGRVIGGVIGIVIGLIAGFLITGLAVIITLTILGLLFDRAVSSNYAKHVRQGGSPAWWAGGTHFGGKPPGGFGGFGGGGFGGGGASGSW